MPLHRRPRGVRWHVRSRPDQDGICDDVDDCVVRTTRVASATALVKSTSAGAQTSPKETVTATETNLTPAAFATVRVKSTSADARHPGRRLRLRREPTRRPWRVWGRLTEDADADGICDDVDDCVGELDACGICNGPEIYECGCADIPEAIATATGTNSTPWVSVVATARRTADADGICDDVDDCVGAYDACGVCNGPERFTNVDALTSLKATATATETSSMPWASAVETARRTPMPMASVTTWMTALANSTPAASATVRGDLRMRMF